MSDKKTPVTAIIVGAGHRSLIYAGLAKEAPDMLKIVGVADPDPIKRRLAAERFDIPENMQFYDADELASKGRLADVIINGTMDSQHIRTAVPLLRLGYDMLLEKPIAVSQDEIELLKKTVKQYKNKVYVCHVLRYAPFYRKVYEHIGDIGDILNIQLTEHVSYHHLVVSYIRGKWKSKAECGAGMLLAKCCHDMDLMMWFAGDARPVSVASFGSDIAFDESKKPDGAGKRCLVDCKVEADCPYSAKKHYIDHPDRWKFYVWDCFSGQTPTLEDKINSLKTDNPYGTCVYGNGHTVVDHQSVLVNFDSGMTATLNMIGGASKAERNVHIIGTKGEIKGVFDDSVIRIRKINQSADCKKFYDEEIIDLRDDGDKSGMTGSHGGGDLMLVRDFVNAVRGEKTTPCASSLDVSIASHLAVFAAEKSRENGTIERICIDDEEK